MTKKTQNKLRKALLLVCSAMLLVSITVVGTVAYLTAQTGVVQNTFTVGNVAITLDEAKAVKNDEDNYVADGTTRVYANTYDLHPGITAVKDPTIKVSEGSEDCYVVAKIEVTATEIAELRAQLGYEGSADMIGFAGMLTGGVMDLTYAGPEDTDLWSMQWTNDDVLLTQCARDNSNVFYVYYRDELKAGDTKVLFDTIKIPSDWDGDDMAALAGLKMEVTAYAVQADGFDNVVDAFIAAFNDEWMNSGALIPVVTE